MVFKSNNHSIDSLLFEIKRKIRKYFVSTRSSFLSFFFWNLNEKIDCIFIRMNIKESLSWQCSNVICSSHQLHRHNVHLHAKLCGILITAMTSECREKSERSFQRIFNSVGKRCEFGVKRKYHRLIQPRIGLIVAIQTEWNETTVN